MPDAFASAADTLLLPCDLLLPASLDAPCVAAAAAVFDVPLPCINMHTVQVDLLQGLSWVYSAVFFTAIGISIWAHDGLNCSDQQEHLHVYYERRLCLMAPYCVTP